MALFQWDDSLSVGVSMMDAQHKRLVEMVNRIYDAMRTSKGDQAVQQILLDLANYTLTHFAAEETLMRRAQYPGLNAHLALHKALIDQVQQMMGNFKAGKMIATVSLATFLKDWLVQHIQKEDRQYGVFIQQQRLVHN